ncbi:hypothetical protein ACFS7Z_19620 [Pontibacter toksunensis]|uniref:Uncharacterized protein n=1 Tax=Pontibacter toksunensis TaxID=1332631 RepID=A0ABW6C004_9BACT
MKKNLDTPFNEGFCNHLEYHLGRTFRNSDRADIMGFWCDGVLCEPITEAELKKTHRIETSAWIGRDGQDEYLMTIKFGKKSLLHFNKGEDLIDTIPGEESTHWIDIDTNKRTIEIRLK